MYNTFMKKSIVFVNTHGYGDILHSRQGVRWIVENLGDQFNYFYIHAMNKDVCFIHENVRVISLPRNLFACSLQQTKNIVKSPYFEDALWIDVWAASFEKMKAIPDCGHKLPDENGEYHKGCEEVQDTTKWQVKLYEEKIKDINNFLIENLSTKKLSVPEHTEFVCKWNDNPKYKFFADKFVRDTSNYKFRIMICNGNTTSNQRRNFIFEDILSSYIKSNPEVCFIFTSKLSEINSDNVYYIDDLFPIPNLDEIEYLMNFCKIIVTSQSGPGCLAFNSAVVYDESKTIILFCQDIVEWYFSDGCCEYIRTSNFDDENVFNLLKSNIDRKINSL